MLGPRGGGNGERYLVDIQEEMIDLMWIADVCVAWRDPADRSLHCDCCVSQTCDHVQAVQKYLAEEALDAVR